MAEASAPIAASIVIPTRERPSYLKVALASIAPQAHAAGAEIVVVDDALPNGEVRKLAARFRARYAPHPAPLGLNAARNTGVEHSTGELVVFVDDDVQVCDGWLGTLLQRAAEQPRVDVFAGRIVPRLEGKPPRSCGREAPPITSLQLGEQDRPACYAWGSNMAIRRSALQRVGPFDVSLLGGGDEQEWQDRLRASGGQVLYVARAALHHRRSPEDARLRALCRVAYARGRAARRFGLRRGESPSLARELLTLAGCLGHVVRRRCPAGMTMVAHSAGRVREALAGRASPSPPPASAPGGSDATHATAGEDKPGGDDFLSGESGTVGGLDGVRRVTADTLADAGEILSGRRLAIARAARRQPATRRVLVLCVRRPEHARLADALERELKRSRHEVELRSAPAGERGKFQNLNLLLGGGPPTQAGSPPSQAGSPPPQASSLMPQADWLIVADDDIVLPRGFLDRFLFLAERFSFDLAQPAHAHSSHAAWRVTRRRRRSVARTTRFVEIGPLTAFGRQTFSTLLPFPGLRMGWGLDVHWGALAQQHGWRCGVVDALAIRHRQAPAASAYSREQALAEARAFLADRPHLTAEEAQRTLATHRTW